MKTSKLSSAVLICSLAAGPGAPPGCAQNTLAQFTVGHLVEGKRLFEQETCGGNGRTQGARPFARAMSATIA